MSRLPGQLAQLSSGHNAEELCRIVVDEAYADIGLEVQRRQGRTITVEADPPQAGAFGEDRPARTVVIAEIVPAALWVVVSPGSREDALAARPGMP